MRRILGGLTAALLLSACGSGVEEFQTARYSADCMTEIYSQIPLRQSSLEFDVVAAKTLLIESKKIRDEKEFCAIFGKMRLTITRAYWVDVPASTDDTTKPEWCHDGFYNSFYGITDNRRLNSLLHEMLHALDGWANIGSDSHCGWDRNGNFHLADLYEFIHIDPSEVKLGET
jgi:hypothetical protein